MSLLSSHACIQFLITSVLSHVHVSETFFFFFIKPDTAHSWSLERLSGQLKRNSRGPVALISPPPEWQSLLCHHAASGGTAVPIHRLQLLPEPGPSLALKINYCMRGWVHYFWIRLKCLKKDQLRRNLAKGSWWNRVSVSPSVLRISQPFSGCCVCKFLQM